ncbi:hypothetical protein [Agromyces aerolatus]|uniref:hypothetical protein n=1 Tax=Agromyces sp. LY-1074 TaxID=3074080 RepID=UPI0028648091|nr:MULTISPECIES: hypothetical protein [unclassified Agromyces]MDR5699211.1 hypothetical protein [Agromyces sp. LY-1074]MDR5705507.1 hypothetical protein [Agromyces sp. LY-1358]
MTGIEFVLIMLGVIVLLSIGVVVGVVLILRSVVRRIRRSPAVGGATLRARARVARGPQRTVLALRVRLDETVRSGRAAVGLAALGAGPSGELPRLFRRVGHEASVLDLQLRLMESETDANVLAEELPAARVRVEQVELLVRRVRNAVASGLSGTSDDALSELGADLDREVAALHVGIDELQRLNRRDGRAGTTGRA